MWLLLSAQESWRVTRAKYRRLSSIPKEQRSCQLVSIILPDCGMQKMENSCKCLKVTRTKSFLANSTMKETLLSLDQRITHVKFGEIRRLSLSLDLKNDRWYFSK